MTVLVLLNEEDTTSGGGDGLFFDGIHWPLIHVYAAFGTSFGAAPDLIRLGVGPGLGTGKLGPGIGWVDISEDVTVIGRSFGRDTELDQAQVGTCTLTVDNRSGDYDPDNLAGPYVSGGQSLVRVGTPIQWTAEYPPGTAYPRFYGELVDIAPDDGYDPTVTFTCADGLEKLGRSRIATVTTPAFDGDTSGGRIGHLADQAAWPSSQRTLDAGLAVLGATVYGDSALELMRKVEQTEVGYLFVNEAGNLVFYDRHHTTSATRSTTVQAALTDTGGATEIEMASLERAQARERMINDWHILRDAFGEDDTPLEQVATDTAAVATFGPLSGGSGLGPLLRTDEEALAMAQGLRPRYVAPLTRIRTVTVDALTQGRWAQLLPLTLLDRISVSRDYGPVTVSAQLLIQAMSEEIRNDDTSAAWTFTFSTSNPLADPGLFILDTSQVGVGTLGW